MGCVEGCSCTGVETFDTAAGLFLLSLLCTILVSRANKPTPSIILERFYFSPLKKLIFAAGRRGLLLACYVPARASPFFRSLQTLFF